MVAKESSSATQCVHHAIPGRGERGVERARVGHFVFLDFRIAMADVIVLDGEDGKEEIKRVASRHITSYPAGARATAKVDTLMEVPLPPPCVRIQNGLSVLTPGEVECAAVRLKHRIRSASPGARRRVNSWFSSRWPPPQNIAREMIHHAIDGQVRNRSRPAFFASQQFLLSTRFAVFALSPLCWLFMCPCAPRDHC